MENQINSFEKKGGLLSWALFFVTYTFGYLGFLAYTETQKGFLFRISDFFIYFLTSGLYFSTAVIIIAALITSQAIHRTFSKTFLFVIIGTIVITIYRSFSYFMFFLKFDQILIIFFILLIAAIIGLVLRKASEKSYLTTKIASSIMILTILGGLFLGIISPNTITKTQCSGFSDRGQRLGCFYNLGIKNSDLDSCLEVPSAIQYPAGPQCVQKALKELENQNKLTTSLCNSLKNPEAKSICFYRIAVITKDKSLCNNVVASYTDKNMSVTSKEPLTIGGPVEVPNKQTCLVKTN